MPVLALRCSVCSENCNSKLSWNDHLLQEDHQTSARKELIKWEEHQKAQVLVVFGKKPVGKDIKVIQHLSKQFGTFVTDFVWWAERPRVGFLQFESEDKVREVLASLHDNQFRLDDGQCCQVKEARNIPELEWDVLLPECRGSPSPGSVEEEDENGLAHYPAPSSPDIVIISSDSEEEEMDVEDSESAENDNDNIPMEPVEASASISGSPRTDSDGEGLATCLSYIRNFIEVPDEEFNVAKDILRRTKGVLSKVKVGSGSRATYSAIISRHFILRLKVNLKTDAANEQPDLHFTILLFKYMDSEESPHFCSMHVNYTAVKAIMNKLIDTRGERGRLRFLTYDVVKSNPESFTKAGTSPGCIKHYTLKLPRTNNSVTVDIATNPSFMVEAQLWHLAKYLFTFDPRCSPLMLVVYYWSRTNRIYVGNYKGTFDNLPNPSPLIWLLIFFLQREGLIPRTKEVLNQTHPPLVFRGTDIGFSESSQLASSWREEKKVQTEDADPPTFAEEIFSLAYQFFLFCSIELGRALNERRTLILSTLDAEIIPLKGLLKCKLTREEKTKLGDSLKNGRSSSGKIILLNPFSAGWRMSTDPAKFAFSAMKVTGVKLRDYFEEEDRGSNVNLDEFLKLLKVEKND